MASVKSIVMSGYLMNTLQLAFKAYLKVSRDTFIPSYIGQNQRGCSNTRANVLKQEKKKQKRSLINK